VALVGAYVIDAMPIVDGRQRFQVRHSVPGTEESLNEIPADWYGDSPTTRCSLHISYRIGWGYLSCAKNLLGASTSTLQPASRHCLFDIYDPPPHNLHDETTRRPRTDWEEMTPAHSRVKPHLGGIACHGESDCPSPYPSWPTTHTTTRDLAEKYLGGTTEAASYEEQGNEGWIGSGRHAELAQCVECSGLDEHERKEETASRVETECAKN
jgi:hypothetical protein